MDRFDRPRQALAIGLAMLAGYVDAIGFLSADGYFVSFMSGNTTRLAVDLALNWRLALTPALLITGFVCGVAGGSVLATKAGVWRKPAVTGLVTTLLLAAASLREIGATPASVGALVLAMGALNSTFQRNGEVAVGLTYMTGALVKLGQALGGLLAGQPRNGWLAHGLLWVGLATGAIAGAILFVRLGEIASWIGAGWAGLAFLATCWLAQREPSKR
ncbi:MAG: YoaK family protein [Novosphingobium sp.]